MNSNALLVIYKFNAFYGMDLCFTANLCWFYKTWKCFREFMNVLQIKKKNIITNNYKLAQPLSLKK